jgi:tetratricopeptide (TPR) repeat protein
LKGDLEYVNSKYDTAQEYYNDALKLYPDYYGAIKSMGCIYFQKSQWDDAGKMFNRTIQMLPEAYDNYIWMGLVMENKQNSTEALNLYNKSISIFPTAGAYQYIGAIYFGQNKVNESIAAYKKAVDLGDKSEDTIQKLGYLLVKVADYTSAKEYNLKYISQYGGNEIVYGNLAYTYEKLSEYQNALNYIEKALEFNEKNIDYINFKLKVLAGLGRRDDAVNYAQSCIDKGYITVNQIDF